MTEEETLQKLNLLGIYDPRQLKEEDLDIWWQKKYKEIKESQLKDKNIKEKLIEINEIYEELSKEDKDLLVEIIIKHSKEENKYFMKGMEYYSGGNFENAIKEFNKVINSDNQFIKSEFYFKRANAKLLSENIYKNNDILNDYNKAIEIEEKPEYYIERGLLNFYIQNYSNGIKDLEVASSNFNNYINLDEIFFDAGMKCSYKRKYPGALKCFTKAIELNSTESRYYYKRAQVTINYIKDNKYHEKIKDFNYESAMSDISKAISLKEDLSYHYRRGLSILKKCGGSVEKWHPHFFRDDLMNKEKTLSKEILEKKDLRPLYRYIDMKNKFSLPLSETEEAIYETEEVISQLKKAIAEFDYVKNNSIEDFDRFPFPDEDANYMLSHQKRQLRILNRIRKNLIESNIRKKRFEEESKHLTKLNIKFKYLPIIILMIPFIRFLIKFLTN